MATFPSNSEFTQLASEKQIEKTVQALQAHGIRVVVFDTGEEARKYVLDLIPSGAEVYNSPSRTLELIGLTEQIEHSNHFQSVRARLSTLDRVRTLEDGLRRIREYSFPLESERTQQVYGQASAINKLLIINAEAYPGRITIVLVKQQLGF